MAVQDRRPPSHRGAVAAADGHAQLRVDQRDRPVRRPDRALHRGDDAVGVLPHVREPRQRRPGDRIPGCRLGGDDPRACLRRARPLGRSDHRPRRRRERRGAQRRLRGRASIAAGLAVGWPQASFNAGLIVGLGVNALICTIGTQFAFRGLAFIWTEWQCGRRVRLRELRPSRPEPGRRHLRLDDRHDRGLRRPRAAAQPDALRQQHLRDRRQPDRRAARGSAGRAGADIGLRALGRCGGARRDHRRLGQRLGVAPSVRDAAASS